MWSDGAIVVGCRHNTLEFVEALLARGRHVAGVVTIGEAVAEKAAVPAWADLKYVLEGRVPVYVARSYKLSDPRDQEALASTRARFGLCVGWQRLLPEWFLERADHGIYGMHASPHRLPAGAGRSPITWGIIEGAEHLYVHVFRYSKAADDGDLLAVEELKISSTDDVHTLQQKCRVIFNVIAERHWDALEAGTMALRSPPQDVAPSFYPKRTPDDGGIDWQWSVRRIVDWVRAQTRPYPGAFCNYGGRRYSVWRAAPLGVTLDHTAEPGTVVEAFCDRTFTVQAGDGIVHILDHDLPSPITIGTRLS